MSHSNRTTLPPGFLWPWDYTGERRPVANADPRMELQPPGDQGYMPNVTTTPPPPNVWMASAPQSGSNALQVPPDAMERYREQQLNALAPQAAGSMFDTAPQKAGGLLIPGNINIHQRPVVRNADGSISTVRSMSFTDDEGRSILIPTVIAGRGIVPPEQAIKHYYQTGQHLGIFEHPDAADAYAQALHERQAGEYTR